MALTTVSSLSEMYSGGTSSIVNDVAIKAAEKAPDTGVLEADPTTTKEGEEATEETEEVEA